ncbi:periostin isoform X1 [Callorhinchus milii]|uniref:Periostin n=1 Tax=Callorhinchus milii TaxID=7868 RepID=V9KAE4_CALMI|nr:periostin isoform X1 [Callorhinchus milii]
MKLLLLTTFSLFVFTSFDQAESSYYDKIVTHSRIRAKTKGPNVCALQQVVGTKKKYFSTCRNWYRKSICGKKAMVLYECCPGYMSLDGTQGCPAVAPIDHVYSTLDIVGATTTQEYSDRSNLRKEIEGIGSFTFFAPSNEAWTILDSEVRNALLSNVNIELLNALHYHMVNKRLMTKDLKNGLTLQSMHDDQTLLINHYSNGVVTVNCARILLANQIATNGVVHVIDRVITAVGYTIEDFIENDEELLSLRAATTASGVLAKLGKKGHYTLFAPTNAAFDKLPQDVLQRILSDPVALKALLNYHILESVQCSEAIMSGSAYTTLEGSNIEIGCDGDSLTINGKKMVNRKDIVTTNGVIHLIDEVLIPDAAMQVLELTSDKQSTFYDLVKETGLSEALRADGEYTLLAPMNDAFTESIMALDQRMLKVILQNHVLKPKVALSELFNEQKLQTLGGNYLRVFVYRTAVCIENSCLIRGSKEGRNGIIHTIRKVVDPAKKSMLEILRADPRFTIFLSLMESADLLDLLIAEGSWTLFVPTDDVFESISPDEMEQLKSNKNALRHILMYHLLKGVFIGGGIEYGVTNILKSYQGSRVMVKLVNETLLVNGLKSKESDIMANNGVIHVVNSLLYPKDLPVANEVLYRFLTRILKYIEIKHIPSYTYKEIRIPYITTHITKITRVITSKPEIRVFSDGETITRVIEGQPSEYAFDTDAESLTKLIREGGTHYTKVTKIIEGDPKLLEDEEIQKLLQGGSSSSKFTKITIDGNPDFEDAEEITRRLRTQPGKRVSYRHRRVPVGARKARQTTKNTSRRKVLGKRN